MITLKEAKMMQSLIEKKVNVWKEAGVQKTYHVNINIEKNGKVGGYRMVVEPCNNGAYGGVFYCIETLVQVASTFGASIYVDCTDNKLSAHIH